MPAILWKNYINRNGGIQIAYDAEGTFLWLWWILLIALIISAIYFITFAVIGLVNAFQIKAHIEKFKEARRKKLIKTIRKKLVVGRIFSKDYFFGEEEYTLGVEYQDLLEFIDVDIKTYRKYKNKEKIKLILITNIDKKGKVINKTLELPV